jgi:hypothetical protein
VDVYPDLVLQFYAGPKDGEPVLLPPSFQPVRLTELEDVGLPRYISFGTGQGRYEFKPDHGRYEWIGNR